MSEKPTYDELVQRIRELEGFESRRKKSEKKLHPSKVRFRQLFTNMISGFALHEIILDDEGQPTDYRFLAVNPAFEKLIGLTSESLLGKTVLTVLPNTETYWIERFGQVAITGEAIEFENFSQELNSHFLVTAYRPATNQFACIFQDITEHKKVEESLRASEAKYRRLTENSPDAIYRMSLPDGKYEYISPSAKAISGYPPEAWYKNPLLIKDIIHSDWYSYFNEQWEQLLKGRVPPTYEYQIVHKDGDVRWLNQRNMPIKDADGRLAAIEGVITDITENKNSEEKLRKSHERFLTVLNSIDATIYVADMQNYEVLFMNKHMIDTFGKDMTGEVCWKAFRGESEKCSHCHHDQLIDKNGKPAGVYIWQDQNPITGRSYINYDRAIEWTDRRIVKLQIATDITEMMHLEEQLRQAQKIESIGNLAGGIAHDFNNILSSMIGYTELALDDVVEGSAQQDDLKEVYRAGMRAKDLVTQILIFARKANEDVKPVNIKSIITESIGLLRSSIATDITIKGDINSESHVIGNPALLEQVIINLVSNAADAMENESGTIEIACKNVAIDENKAADQGLLGKRDHVQIIVSDNGTGIAPDLLDKIFDPYFTTKELGKGTGMGLATVYGTIKKYGGSITVKSQLGQGTVFTILLPVTEVAQSVSDYQSDILPTGSEHILVVDDDPAIVKLTKLILERLGYTVTARTNSVEALELFTAIPDEFDLVLSDVTMPNLSGDKLTIELMKIRPTIPVMLYTEYSEKISEQTAADIGVKAFAYKPIVKADLGRTLRKVLDEVNE